MITGNILRDYAEGKMESYWKRSVKTMPIYIYKCVKCEEVFELLQLPGREEKVICPKCNSDDCSKQITASCHRYNRRTF